MLYQNDSCYIQKLQVVSAVIKFSTGHSKVALILISIWM